MATTTPLGNVPRFAAGLQEVADGVYAWLQPNGGLGESNAGLIVGASESLLVDTLWTLPLTRAMLAAFESAAGRGAPIRRLVNTHSDGDHFWGNQLVGAAEIVATRAAAERMRDESPRALGLMGAAGRRLSPLGRRALPVPGGEMLRGFAAFTRLLGAYDFGGIELTTPTLTFDGSLELEVGGRAVDVVEVGPAHTEGDAIVHVRDAGVVFAADVMFVGVTPIIWAGPVGNWLAALERILELEPRVVVPGHGPVTDAEGVRAMREYWEVVEVAARTRHAAGMSREAAALDIARSPEFTRPGFASWDEPGRLLVNVAMLYRGFEGTPGRVSDAERARLLAGMPRIADAAR
jgi:glyoxylase-like metal-dependent hydrolase (beta-lactamase superfamily II)